LKHPSLAEVEVLQSASDEHSTPHFAQSKAVAFFGRQILSTEHVTHPSLVVRLPQSSSVVQGAPHFFQSKSAVFSVRQILSTEHLKHPSLAEVEDTQSASAEHSAPHFFQSKSAAPSGRQMLSTVHVKHPSLEVGVPQSASVSQDVPHSAQSARYDGTACKLRNQKAASSSTKLSILSSSFPNLAHAFGKMHSSTQTREIKTRILY
jgi:hypothetical protein